MVGILFWICVALVFYVYAGYPLLVYLISALFGKEPKSQQIIPRVTILFSALNEEKVISEKLENCLALDYPKESLQILVVSDGSTDSTAKIVEGYLTKGIDFLDLPVRKGKLAALRNALPLVKGEIILFSDADNYYPANALLETVKYFCDPTVGAVSGGRNVLGDGVLRNAEGLYWKYEEFIKRHESRIGSCVGVAGDLLAVRKNLYASPPENIINDDFFNVLGVLRQGFRILYAPDARSYHPVAKSDNQEIERRARMVAGRYQAIFSLWQFLPWKYPVSVWQIVSHKYLRPLVPIFMILAFIFSVTSLVVLETGTNRDWLYLYYPYNWVFFVAQLIFYFIAWLGMRKKFTGIIGKILYIPSFLVNSNLAALQGLYRFVTSKQSVLWKKAER